MIRGTMFGPVRSVHWLTLAAVLPVVGCGAPADESGDSVESVGSTELAATVDVLDARLYRKRSSALKYRGTGADWITCAGDPVNMGITFGNRGEATWRDVDGKGNTAGSDVKLVTASGKKDTMVGRTYLSLADNKNDQVRGAGTNADWCSSKPGCRRTYFNADHLWTVAPKTPGYYGGRWRMRDYSAVHDTTSVAFSGKVRMRFRVVACEGRCGCSFTCSDGTSNDVAADAASCEAIASAACEPSQLVNHQFIDCNAGGSGGTSGSGGGWGTGGTGGGSSGGTGGTGAGGTSGSGGGWGTGGSGATGSGGTSGGFSCGGATCEVPEPLIGQVELCCTAAGACGIKGTLSTGQCIGTSVPDPDDPDADEEPGSYSADEDHVNPDNNKDTPDEAGFFDPNDAVASDQDPNTIGGGREGTDSGGCAIGISGRAEAANIGLFALLALAARRRRRR